MTVKERFLNTLNFKPCDDRGPMVEWAAWWDKTIDRWRQEGPEEIREDMSYEDIQDHFGLDKLLMLSGSPKSKGFPKPAQHGGGVIVDEKGYEEVLPFLYTEERIESLIQRALSLKERHDKGEIALRLWLDGYFWFPRGLFGIENHMYAFYDYPELMKRINHDLASFNLRVVKRLFEVLLPDMVGFAEDMSYNHGPMLSYDCFKEFIMPYYQMVIPEIKKHGVKVLIDSDGDIAEMIPWMRESGIEGVYPLEKQAGVDIVQIRKDYKDFIMLGGYDKMVMVQGEAEMRAEFERILPVMRSGGYIPSVDHQTPPGVSLENYKIYIKLFQEYSKKAQIL